MGRGSLWRSTCNITCDYGIMSVMCFSLSPLVSGTVHCYWALPIHLLLCCVDLDMGGGIKLTKGAAQELWCEWTIVCPMNLHILWYFINFKLTAKLCKSILNLNMVCKQENNIISKTNAQFWLFYCGLERCDHLGELREGTQILQRFLQLVCKA